jgi:hypothetical protein
MPDGTADLHRIAARLREAGKEGQGLRKELTQALTDAAGPLAKKISSLEHLRPYLPDRYAEVLAADLSARVASRFGANPRIEVRAKARDHKRKIVLLDDGFINHPVYPRGPRRDWNWKNRQTGGMKPGFFADACRDARPDIRNRVMQALADTARQITS